MNGLINADPWLQIIRECVLSWRGEVENGGAAMAIHDCDYDLDLDLGL
jgi:hypothetical protein